jgi:hypothetical protein
LRNAIPEGAKVKTRNHDVQPVAINSAKLQVLTTTMHIHDLSIEQPAVVAYLQAIDPGKQEIALVHAIQVGITELVARRARARAALPPIESVQALRQDSGSSGQALRQGASGQGRAGQRK